MSDIRNTLFGVGETVYDVLTDEEDARICADIDEAACRERPLSFLLILASSFLTKLGDALSSPKTTLAWAATAVGAPAFVLGFLVPIRESGSMVPQLFIGSYIRQLAVRKWVWVAGSVVQFLAVAAMGLVVLSLEGAAAGWALLALVTLFSLARGFCSVASKDVMGKTIPKPKRGQLTGWSASLAGAVSIGVGIVLMMPDEGRLGEAMLGLLLMLAGALWLLASLIYAQVPEQPGETGGARNAVEALRQLSLLATDQPFRRFVITRALLMCSALSAPFYVALAQQEVGSPAWLLGAFVAAAGVASLVSAPLWGRFADRSSKAVMVAAALITSGVGLFTLLAWSVMPALIATAWYLPAAYFVLSTAHSGVRVGRKTYVVNLAGGNRRTDYVAISNSVIGVLLLLVGTVGLLTPLIGHAGVIGLLALMGLAGAALGATLPDTA
ncbi:MAG: MFS transporter [Xanthomonadales bacterium]